jgi:hypothetical protein
MSPETSGFFSRVLSSACFVGPVWALAIEATVVLFSTGLDLLVEGRCPLPKDRLAARLPWARERHERRNGPVLGSRRA